MLIASVMLGIMSGNTLPAGNASRSRDTIAAGATVSASESAWIARVHQPIALRAAAVP